MGSFGYLFIINLSIITFSAPSFGKKNVLFIIVDDLRPALKCYGDDSAYTPNIDSLAQHSFVFANAYAQQALCGPSRTSLLTSRSPHHLRQYDAHRYWRSSAGNFTSLPQYFRENGYNTMSIGKVFHPGKCSNFDDQPYSWSQKPFHPKTEKYKNYPVCPDVNGSGPSKSIVCPVLVDSQPGGTLPDLESVEAAKNYLDCHIHGRSDEPFFLAVGFQKPHIPLKFPTEYLNYHPIENVLLPSMRSFPPGMPSSAWNPWNDLRKRDDIHVLNISFPWGQMPDNWAKKLKQSYYASVSYVDHLIGQLLHKLDALGQRNNTAILVTSDHGWSVGEHGEWSKYSNYDVSTRVPFILSIPGRKGGQVTNLVELLDIFPTLADVAGLETIPKCENGYSQILCTDGISLMDIIGNSLEKELWRDGAYSLYPRPGVYPSLFPDSDQPHQKNIKVMGYSIRTLRHRFTEWVQFNIETMVPVWWNSFGAELYDHVIDPNETLNLYDRPHLKPLVVSLKNKLRRRWSH